MNDLLSFKAWGIEATASGSIAIAALVLIVLAYLTIGRRQR